MNLRQKELNISKVGASWARLAEARLLYILFVPVGLQHVNNAPVAAAKFSTSLRRQRERGCHRAQCNSQQGGIGPQRVKRHVEILGETLATTSLQLQGHGCLMMLN